MKKLPQQIEKYRVTTGAGVYNSDASYGNNGAFRFPLSRNRTAMVIISDGDGWDHVSVHVKHLRPAKGNKMENSIPTWEEMCRIKDMFFDKDECVMQFHPPKSKYVNIHDHTLHLWRPQNKDIPQPPVYMV